MAALPKIRLTVEEYLAIERKATQKSEFLAGEMFAMAGGSERHNLIITNVISELRTQLKKRPCKVYPSDMRVKVSQTGLFTYPDVVVVCGSPAFVDNRKDTLLNPTLIVEVLSESTEAYDRGKKFAHYRRLPSLVEYILIAQNQVRVEQFVKQNESHWLFSEISDLEAAVQLTSIEGELLVAEIYDKVEFE